MQFQKRILLALMVTGLMAPAALAQAASSLGLRTIRRDAPRPRRFTAEEIQAAGTGLPTWTGSFTHAGKTYKYVMVGIGQPVVNVPEHDQEVVRVETKSEERRPAGERAFPFANMSTAERRCLATSWRTPQRTS